MKKIAFLLLLISSIYPASQAQEACFVFYNVENLFDTENDPATADDEFTPEGEKHWTYDRYASKLDRIAQVLTAIGGWELPAIVGLCEVENRKVLLDLANHRLLKEYGYEILHRDSPDERGIDVAMLFKRAAFNPIAVRWIPIRFKSDTSDRTRDILYVKGLLLKSDTLHVFINHWPSRWGGTEVTMPGRFETAYHLYLATDSIFKSDPGANILIAGDLNDTPEDLSVSHVLKAQDPGGKIRDGNLYNLMTAHHQAPGKGTLKYQANWQVFDQIIVSANLLHGADSVRMNGGAGIFDAEFLFEDDERYLGVKPFRTYSGPQYLDGYSDHLPVYLRFIKEQKTEKDTIH